MKKAIVFVLVLALALPLLGCNQGETPKGTDNPGGDTSIMTTDPKPTDPQPTDPKPTDSKPTEPSVCEEHTYSGGKCVNCGKSQPSQGLEFTKNGNSYMLTGIGSCADSVIVIPEEHEGLPVTAIGAQVFSFSNATGVEIPASISSLDAYAFHNWIEVQSFAVDAGSRYFMAVDGVLFTADGKILVRYPSASSAAEYAVPEGVTQIHSLAFYNANALVSITLPSSLRQIDRLGIAYCTKLQHLELPQGLESIGARAFLNCWSITGMEIPAGVTYIGEGAFENCDVLEKITVAKNNGKYCDVDGVLFDKNITVLMAYPNGRSGRYEIPQGVTEIAMSAFAGSDLLTEIKMPDSLAVIGEDAFESCRGLTDVTVGDGVSTIMRSAFFQCENLKTVTVGKNVTKINSGAFSACYALSSVVFLSTDGWTVSLHEDGWNGTEIDVNDPAAAAQMLTETYKDNYWLRNAE